MTEFLLWAWRALLLIALFSLGHSITQTRWMLRRIAKKQGWYPSIAEMQAMDKEDMV